MLICICDLRTCMVSTIAMPTLAPILRITLKMLVALPILSLGMGSFVTVVKGTKMRPSPAPCTVSGNQKFDEATPRLKFEIQYIAKQWPENPQREAFAHRPSR